MMNTKKIGSLCYNLFKEGFASIRQSYCSGNPNNKSHSSIPSTRCDACTASGREETLPPSTSLLLSPNFPTLHLPVRDYL